MPRAGGMLCLKFSCCGFVCGWAQVVKKHLKMMAWKMMEQDLTNEYGICWSHSMQMVWGSFGGTSVGDVLDTLTYIDFIYKVGPY